jgi:hypothetical protein
MGSCKVDPSPFQPGQAAHREVLALGVTVDGDVDLGHLQVIADLYLEAHSTVTYIGIASAVIAPCDIKHELESHTVQALLHAGIGNVRDSVTAYCEFLFAQEQGQEEQVSRTLSVSKREPISLSICLETLATLLGCAYSVTTATFLKMSRPEEGKIC